SGPGRRTLSIDLAVAADRLEIGTTGANAEPAQLLAAVRQAAQVPPDAGADSHDRAGPHLDHLIVERKLPSPAEEEVELFQYGMGVPERALLPGLRGVHRQTDEPHPQL